MIGYGIGKIILNCRLYEFTNKKLQEREIPIPNKKNTSFSVAWKCNIILLTLNFPIIIIHC